MSPSRNPEPPEPDYFDAIGAWCEHSLQFQHGPDVARTFAELLRIFGQLAGLTADFQQDQFDRRKQLEATIDDLLRKLALAHAESLESRQRRSSGSASEIDGRTRLFVYGTLKRGYSRAAAMATQRFLGEARTTPAYRMYDCGSYPGLAESPEDGLEIEGEVWEVDAICLTELDEVEGVAFNLYRRGHVDLQAPFAGTPVQTYFYQRSTNGLRDCGQRWP